ncbi:hypothetical protein [Candidatus Tisiphia endosymbiont of Oplodontha viridula]|uniref:hypothetical protein n=1 Tax=Candidatus Tisiphia endosymbiont of Oplodontha viridula TaxID=3077925 RepID=UPI0035C8CBFC
MAFKSHRENSPASLRGATLDTVNKAYLIDELMDFLAKINKIFAGIVYLFQKNLIICSKKNFIHQLNKLC